jgi:hypothetical protein
LIVSLATLYLIIPTIPITKFIVSNVKIISISTVYLIISTITSSPTA